jgi:ketosteroid isomerase-like protein
MSEAFRGLIETFGRGWEQGDADAIVSVFTPDAAFLDDPFSTKQVGPAAIRSYWADLPKNQAEVSFKLGEILSAGAWFAAEYRCTFRRRRTGEWVDVRGAMFCETRDGKISELRMYVHRRPDA